MAINFPNNPSLNDTFSSGGITFTWNGEAWKTVNTTIQGIQGTQGIQGAQSVQGIQGAQGISGTQSTVYFNVSKGEQVILLHLDGSNNDTSDNDVQGRTWSQSAGSTATLSTAQTKFGNTSLLIPATTGLQGFETPVSANVSLLGAWTLEFWFYPIAVGTEIVFIGNIDTTANDTGGNREWQLYSSSQTQLNYYSGQRGSSQITRSWTIASYALNTWHHVVFARDGGSSLYAWVDGVYYGSPGTDGNANYHATKPVRIGKYSASTSVGNWYMDEIRLVHGDVIYPLSNITVPVAAFPDVFSLAGGVQGTQGPQGVQGTQGPQGVQGLDGAFAGQGVQGIQGVQGPTSDAGAAVIISPTSPGGSPGPQAGDLWWDEDDEILYIAAGSPLMWIPTTDVGIINQNPQTTSYELTITDAGKHIYKSSGGAATITIPANSSVPFEVGTIISLVNDDTEAMTIAITTDTLVWAGDGSTGSRSLGQYGMATITKVASTRWFISGIGVT